MFQVFKEYIQMDSFEHIHEHYDKYIKQQNAEEFINMMMFLDLKSFGSIKTIINRLIYNKLVRKYEDNLPELIQSTHSQS